MKEQLIVEVLSEPTKWVLTNKKGDTFTFNPNTGNGEELSDFLMGCKALTSVNSESAEEVLNKYPSTKIGLDDFYGRQTTLKAMHDFANNSEAMKDCQITFGNHFKTKFRIVDNRIEILDAINGWGNNVPKEEIKVEYLTNKEK